MYDYEPKEGLGKRIKDNYLYLTEEMRLNAREIKIGLALGIMILAGTFPISMGVYILKSDKAIQNADIVLNEKREELGNNLAQKYNLNEFDVKSFEIQNNESKYLLNVFGISKLDNFDNGTYENLSMDIKYEDALAILNCMEQRENLTKYINQEKLFINESARGEKAIKKAQEVCEEIYSLLNIAITNCYNSYKTEIGQTNVIDRQIVQNKFGNDISKYSKDNFFITNISLVYPDSNRNLNFFYVDTLSSKLDENGYVVYEKQRARIEVNDVNLSAEEVYAKFIEGRHNNFEILSNVSNQEQINSQSLVF